MNVLNKIIITALSIFLCGNLFALSPRTMTIKNNTGASVAIYFSDFDCMYPSHGGDISMDKLQNTVIGAGKSIQFYEECENSGWDCYWADYRTYLFHAYFLTAPYIKASIEAKIEASAPQVDERNYGWGTSTLANSTLNISEGDATFYINAPSDPANPDDS